MKARIMNRKGFSLIELMIVVAIIGILAAIAVPNFQKFQRKAKQAEARGMLGSYHTAVKSAAAEVGCFKGNWVAVGFAPEGQLTYRMIVDDNPLCVLPTSPQVATDATCVSTAVASACTPVDAAGVALGVFPRTWFERPVGPVAPVGAALTTNDTFFATASANLGVTGQTDEWSMNQNKDLQNPASGL